MIGSRVKTDKMPPLDPGEERTAVNYGDDDLRLFDYEHLDEPQRSITERYRELAAVLMHLPRNRRRARAIERLAESLEWARSAPDRTP